MRAFRPKSFLIKRFEEGWSCHAEGEVLTNWDKLPTRIAENTYGKLRFLTYVRGVFALRKKARAMRAPRGGRKSQGWSEAFVD